MNGEIINEHEMREAKNHALHIDAVLVKHPMLTQDLQPIRDFLNGLAWRGIAR